MGLVNAGFEADWGDEKSHQCLVFPVIGAPGYFTDIGNIFTPPGWTTWYVHEPGIWDQPEVRDAWKNIDPRRVYTGNKGVLFFTYYRRHWGGFYQQVPVTRGQTLEFSCFLHAWSNHDGAGFPHKHDGRWSEGVGYDVVSIHESNIEPDNGDPQHDAIRNATFRVGIDPYGGSDPLADSVVWSDHYSNYNGYLAPLVVEAIAQADSVTVFIESKRVFGFCHGDFYADDASLTVVASPEPPEPEERQFSFVAHAAPQDVTLLELAEVIEQALPEKQTISLSLDHAALGNNNPHVTDATIHVWAADRIAGSRAGLEAWLQTYYPPLPTLIYHEFTTDTPPIPDPEPPATAGYRNYMGPHLQTMVPGWDTYIKNAHPTCAKAFSWNDVAGVKTRFPHLHVIGRHCTNDYGNSLENPDPAQGAKNWVDKFRGALYETCDRLAPLNLSEDEPWFYVESVNEVYPPAQRAATFDLAFIHELASTGLPIAPIVMTAAVGNPHESEFALLLPLARACAAAKGAFGYHAYWYANSHESGLVPYWQWLAGRWEEIDKVLVANGVRVKWFFGETGAVGGEFVPASAPGGLYSAWSADLGPKCIEQGGIVKPVSVYIPKTQRGMPLAMPGAFAVATAQQDGGFILLPGDGWKSDRCYGGDFGRYLDDQRTFNVMASETDAGRRGDILGGAEFTSAIGCGWESFQIHGPEWQQMEALA